MALLLLFRVIAEKKTIVPLTAYLSRLWNEIKELLAPRIVQFLSVSLNNSHNGFYDSVFLSI